MSTLCQPRNGRNDKNRFPHGYLKAKLDPVLWTIVSLVHDSLTTLSLHVSHTEIIFLLPQFPLHSGSFPLALPDVRRSLFFPVHLNGTHSGRPSVCSRTRSSQQDPATLGLTAVHTFFLVVLFKVCNLGCQNGQVVKAPDSKSVIGVFMCVLVSFYTGMLIRTQPFHTSCSSSGIMPTI